MSISARSLAKALEVRIPEMLDSTAALISPVFFFTSLFAFCIRRRSRMEKARQKGRISTSTMVSFQLMVKRTIRAPAMVMTQVRMFSGPWWASSTISNRSLAIRVIRTPVRWVSKKLKDSSCMWVKMFCRMSASTRVPMPWPMTVTLYWKNAFIM